MHFVGVTGEQNVAMKVQGIPVGINSAVSTRSVQAVTVAFSSLLREMIVIWFAAVNVALITCGSQTS